VTRRRRWKRAGIILRQKKEKENNSEAKTAKKEKENNSEAKTDANEEEIVRRKTSSNNVKEDTIEVEDEKMSRVRRIKEEEKDPKGDDGKRRGERSQQWFYQEIPCDRKRRKVHPESQTKTHRSRGVQTRLKDKDSDVEKRLVQVEKISKLILGEIRQIRQIIETENCQVSPAVELSATFETNSNGDIFTPASDNSVASVKSEIKERLSCTFEQEEKAIVRNKNEEQHSWKNSKSRDLEEKLRNEPELLFCCCS